MIVAEEFPTIPTPEEFAGLKPKGSKKLEIVEENMDINQFSTVIGPLYIIKHLAVNPQELPQAPFNHLLPIEPDVEDEVISIRNDRQNKGFAAKEKMLRQADGRSRFYGSGQITWRKRRGRGDLLGNSRKKRGLLGNMFLRRNIQRFLPKSWRILPHSLNVIQTTRIPIIGLNSIKRWNGTKTSFAYLPKFQTGKYMSFNIYNTVRKLEDVSEESEKTIVLQWSRGGTKRSIRNIRVDGMPDETVREKFAFYLDRKIEPVLKFIRKNKLQLVLVLIVNAILWWNIFIHPLY